MSKEKINESSDSTKKESSESKKFIKWMSEKLIGDLNAGRGDYIEWRNDYLDWLDGADKFPDRIGLNMIKAGRGDEVLRHIDKFEPTQKLAEALLKDMIKNGFYEDKEKRDMGYHDYLLEDSVIAWEDFLCRFGNLDKSIALLVLELLDKNMYTGADAAYLEHLGDCFNPSYFTGLDEGILKRLSDRGKIIEDEDKNRFIGIDEEKREKYTNIALSLQEDADKAYSELDDELDELDGKQKLD